MNIKFNTATAQQIAFHLHNSEPAYVEYLIARVNLEHFANKIKMSAHCFEAWEKRRLVGLVAAYLNTEEKSGYVTNVSVLPAWQSRGVARLLLQECINNFEYAGVKKIGLEVALQNVRAQQFYIKHGFKFTCETTESFKMIRYCR